MSTERVLTLIDLAIAWRLSTFEAQDIEPQSQRELF